MFPEEFAILRSITRFPVLVYKPSMGLVPHAPLIEYHSMFVFNTLSNDDRATVMAGRSCATDG